MRTGNSGQKILLVLRKQLRSKARVYFYNKQKVFTKQRVDKAGDGANYNIGKREIIKVP